MHLSFYKNRLLINAALLIIKKITPTKIKNMYKLILSFL